MELDTRTNFDALYQAVTPMMKQYLNIKGQHEDCLLMYRLGDFYELFFEDAVTASRELELTLTGRDCGLPERAPMCGVPHHALNGYLEKLIAKGYRVAVCEQMEDPATAKGLVERDVIRVFTPGTVNDPSMLDERSNNFLLSVCFGSGKAGLAFADVSTGEFFARDLDKPEQRLGDEVARIRPSEVITNDLAMLRTCLGFDLPAAGEQSAAWFGYSAAAERLREHFRLADLTPLGLNEGHRQTVCAAGALMRYLNDTQKNALEHLSSLRLTGGSGVMLLDPNTRRNLELTEGIRSRTRRGSLLWLLDRTSTAMGGRLLRSWVEEPLTDHDAILERQEAVAEMVGQHVLTLTLASELKGVYDIERLLSKVSYRTLNARDCMALGQSLERVPGIRGLLEDAQSPMLCRLRDGLDPMEDLRDLIDRAVNPDAPITITEGGIIRSGYSAALDEYRSAATDGKRWILELEQRERERTGIRNLRVQYNHVFGYYIEVTKSYLDMVPDDYTRRQTMANAERFVTPELKELEQKIIGAQEQAVRLELQLFNELREKIAGRLTDMQRVAASLKALDAILSLAQAAVENRYVRPEITEDGAMEIIAGRHPVVEAMLTDEPFVPNDTHMDPEEARMLIITGPNMAGKSTYMRQVALITLMAHIGSFVPADSARIPIVDRIFTRVGASDDLASGQSTFMVEMSETAHILRTATANSLIILDEIGRGTSTFDGMAIAWAVVEHLSDPKKCGAKTLFATHYHELSELEGHIPGVRNYRSTVKEHGESVIFLRRIERGGADKSYGIHVARLAGIPEKVVRRAQEIQARLEVSDVGGNNIGRSILGETDEKPKDMQMDLFAYKQTELVEELKALDVMAMTPMDALNQLFMLREKARKI